MSLAAPAIQVCTFALGCALIHACKAHADSLTRILMACAAVSAVLLLLGASLAIVPEDDASLDEVTLYAAL